MKGLWIPLVAVSLLSPLPAAAQLGGTVPNWPVSSGGTSSRRGMTTQSDVTDPLPFIGVTPCRVVDTRGPAGTFGGPALAAGSPRTFPIPSGPCVGIPFNAQAFSLNVTVTTPRGRVS